MALQLGEAMVLLRSDRAAFRRVFRVKAETTVRDLEVNTSDSSMTTSTSPEA